MGFAQEIRDFLGASQSVIKTFSDQSHKLAQDKYTNAKTDETIKEMNDPLNAKIKEATLAQKLAATSLAKGRLALEQQTAALASKPIQKPAGAADAISDTDTDTSGGGGGAAASAAAPGPRVERKPDPYYARGGLVRKFAEGGAVEEEDLSGAAAPALPTLSQPIGSATIGRPTRQASPVAQPAPAIGGGTAAAEGDSYDIGARSRKPSAAAIAAATEVEPPSENAIAESAKYGVQVIGGGEAVNTTVGRMKLEQYMRGAGAAPINEMYDIYKKIDPTGKKYSESERNLRAFNALYNFKLNSNDAEGAKKVGAAMLQHHRTAYERYKAIAAAALDGGNIDVATKAAMKAYANILDGKDLKLWVGEGDKVGYSYTDKNGDTIKKGIMSPQELGSVISGQNAKTYDQWLMTAAGAAQQEIDGNKAATPAAIAAAKAKDEKGGKSDMLTPSEYEKMKDRTDQFVDKWNAEQQKTPEGKKGLKLEPKEVSATKNMLFHTMTNNKLTEDEGLRRVTTFVTAPAPKEGELPPFRRVDNPETKMTTLHFPDNFSMEIPTNTYNGTWRVARGEALARRENPPPPEETWSDTVAPAVKGAKNIVDEQASRLSDYGEGFKRQNPEMYARGKSAVGAIGNAVGDAVDWAKRDWAKGSGPPVARPTTIVPPNDDDIRPNAPVSQ
jgi:hypothetical protein